MSRRLITATISLLILIFVSAGQISAQQKSFTVSGTVTGMRDGEPLVGATVNVTGTQVFVVTDLDGHYSIDVPVGTKTPKLNFSYLGYEASEKAVNKAQVLDIQLSEDTVLEEAVITAGYGLAQKRSDMTGSAFQVESKQFQSLPAARVDNMLSGMVPGLTIDESSTPAARTRYNIRVRGDASLSANSEPLWIIDGVPIYTGDRTGQVTGTSYSVSPMSYINPDDIESITVLKDAATTSIYGADGANGVILVTTKQSSGDGAVHVTASARYGVSKVDPSTLIKLCNAEQWMQLAQESWVNSGFDLQYFPYRDNEYNSYSTTDTDWHDVYLGTGSNSEFSIRVDSGTNKARHYLSLNYYDEESTIKGNSQQRLAFRDRASYKFGDKLSADLNLAVTYNVNDIFSVSTSDMKVIPIFSPYDEDGVTPRLYNYWSDNTDKYEPSLRKFVYNQVPEREFSDNFQRSFTIDGNATLEYNILKGLKFTSMVGVNSLNIHEMMYDPKTTLDGITSYEQDGHSSRSGVFNYTWNNIDRLNFNRTFGKHSVTALLGIEFVNKENRSLSASGSGFANDHIKEVNYSISDSRRGGSTASNSRSLSYLSQATYSYDSRYYLSLSYRRQGNSGFSSYSRWGDFSSVGLSWNAHNENFFNIPFISRLKLKASYGNSGNSRVDTSAAYGTYTYSEGKYYGGLMGATQASAPNPGLSWETTYITNIGLDLGLFDDRIDLSAEYYNKYTKDLLYDGRVSSIISDGTVTRNVGEIENKGFEISLNTKNIVRKHFSWTTDFNGAVNRNVIRKLYKGMHTGFFSYIWIEGASKDAWWLSRWAGVDPATGNAMWYDINDNLTSTYSYNNRVLLPQYSKEPDFRGGLRNTFTWGDFSLVVFLNYTLGGWDHLYDSDDGYDIISTNVVVEKLDHWKKPGDVSPNPKPLYKISTNSSLSSTRYLYSTTNIQLKNVALTYNIPKEFCRKLKVRSASVSVIGDNLYFWTPDQSRDHNSYKTLRYAMGVTRSLSGQLTLNF